MDITVKTYKETLDRVQVTFDLDKADKAENLFKNTGFHIIKTNNMLLIDSDILNTKDYINILSNVDDNLFSKEINNFKITIEIPEKTKISQIPEFGLTMNDNLNIIQTNLNNNMVNGMLSLYSYWDTDSKLHVGTDVMSKEKIQMAINAICAGDQYAPIVFYIDDKIMPYCYECMAYIYNILGSKFIPTRVICYKDIKYIEGMDKELHDKLLTIPHNEYYTPEDEVDFSSSMIINFSDKRLALSLYCQTIDNENDMMSFKLDDMIQCLYFVFSGDNVYKNKNLCENILANDEVPLNVFPDGTFDEMGFGPELYWRLHNQAKILPSTDGDVKFEGLQVKSIIDFDCSKYAFARMKYDKELDDRVANKLENIQTNFFVVKDTPETLYGTADINSDVLKNKLKVAILG